MLSLSFCGVFALFLCFFVSLPPSRAHALSHCVCEQGMQLEKCLLLLICSFLCLSVSLFFSAGLGSSFCQIGAFCRSSSPDQLVSGDMPFSFPIHRTNSGTGSALTLSARPKRGYRKLQLLLETDEERYVDYAPQATAEVNRRVLSYILANVTVIH